MKYRIAHIGINCDGCEDAKKTAALFEALFGMAAEEGENSVFAGRGVECLKSPQRGKNGHIAIHTDNLAEAVKELEAKGVVFDPASVKYKPDGGMKIIYLAEEIRGFAIHLTEG